MHASSGRCCPGNFRQSRTPWRRLLHAQQRSIRGRPLALFVPLIRWLSLVTPICLCWHYLPACLHFNTQRISLVGSVHRRESTEIHGALIPGAREKVPSGLKQFIDRKPPGEYVRSGEMKSPQFEWSVYAPARRHYGEWRNRFRHCGMTAIGYARASRSPPRGSARSCGTLRSGMDSGALFLFWACSEMRSGPPPAPAKHKARPHWAFPNCPEMSNFCPRMLKRFASTAHTSATTSVVNGTHFQPTLITGRHLCQSALP